MSSSKKNICCLNHLLTGQELSGVDLLLLYVRPHVLVLDVLEVLGQLLHLGVVLLAQLEEDADHGQAVRLGHGLGEEAVLGVPVNQVELD